MGNDLVALREQITEIDITIAQLLQKRFEVVEDVANIKMQNKIPVLDLSREAAVLENYCRYISPRYHKAVAIFVNNILDASKSLQQEKIDDGNG